jgi:hypothetical protein
MTHDEPEPTGSSDPDPKISGWTFETDRVYNYEIKGGDNKDSWKEKSNERRE